MFHPQVGNIPWRRKQQPTLLFFPGNPMDREAWQPRVHGGLKRVRHDLVTEQQQQQQQQQNTYLAFYWNYLDQFEESCHLSNS